MCWNICGLINKVNLPHVVKFCKNFDIFAFVETWVCQAEEYWYAIDGFSTYVNDALRFSKQGRRMGGLIVYVTQSLTQYVTRLESSCKFCIFLKVNRYILGTDKDVLMCFVYLPPLDSPAYVHESVRGIDLLQHYIHSLDVDF